MHKEESVGSVRETEESRAHATSAEARGPRVKVSTGPKTRGQTGSGQCSVGTNGCAECDSSNTACTKCDPNDSSNKRYLKDGVCVPTEECTGSNDHYTDSSDTSSLACKPCSQDQKPNAAGSQCFACPNSGATANCVRGDAANTCAWCTEGYETLDGGQTCTEKAAGDCGVSNCKTCSADKKACEECSTNNYLTPTNQCIDQCATIPGYYGATEGSKKVCKKCGVENCEACNEQGQCQTCSNGFYLTANECKACDSSCRTCSGATNADCTACPSGKALTYGSDGAKGSC